MNGFHKISSGFRDGNGVLVCAGDVVEYRFGARRGVLVIALQDGDADVRFDDGQRETVKWCHLCKVPPQYFIAFPPLVSLAPATPRTIIAFTGLAGAGKSTAALHLVERHGFQRIRFAGPLKAMMGALGLSADEVDGNRKELPCELLGGKTPRHAMQTIGTEWGRDLICSDLWIRAFRAALDKVPVGVPVVIDDCRFPNEAEAVAAAGGILVRIERPGAGTASSHVSEAHSLPASRTLHNTLSERNLREQVDALLADISWADRET
jgi:hypothetical protein